MGTYLNPGSRAYEIAANSEIFVDKSEMLSYLNAVVNTKHRLSAFHGLADSENNGGRYDLRLL